MAPGYGYSLIYGGGYTWKFYQDALIPASPYPTYINLPLNEQKRLLKESGALFIRYTNNPTLNKTAWWYNSCDYYNLSELSSNTRNQVRRGNRECKVKKVDPGWLANHGYHCYRSAYNRYTNAIPVGEEVFRQGILATAGSDVFEYWAVFVDDNLAGYCQCIVEDGQVATSVIKYNPDYLRNYSSYALISGILEHYIAERGMIVSNGTRTIAHDTNVQEYLAKFGFQKRYCKLCIFYRFSVGCFVKAVYPFRKIVLGFPRRGIIHKIQAVLYQEQLRRDCIID